VPDMSSSTTYRALVAQAAGDLAEMQPDGPAVQRALLLAAHAGLHRRGGDADWDLYTVAVTQAVADVQADLAEPVVLTEDVPAPGPDSAELRLVVVNLLRRLADLYATAAAGPAGSPWRRLVWAQVAHRLDDAVAELT
jgi:hypothetical protein